MGRNLLYIYLRSMIIGMLQRIWGIELSILYWNLTAKRHCKNYQFIIGMSLVLYSMRWLRKIRRKEWKILKGSIHCMIKSVIESICESKRNKKILFGKLRVLYLLEIFISRLRLTILCQKWCWVKGHLGLCYWCREKVQRIYSLWNQYQKMM